MAQATIENFFHKRKRSAIDDYPSKSKVLILGHQNEKNATLHLEKELDSNGQKIIYRNNVQDFTSKNLSNGTEKSRAVNLIQNPFVKFPKPKNTPVKSERKTATAALLPNQKTLDSFMTKLNVPFELKGDLSPRKKLSTFSKPKDVPLAVAAPSTTSSSEKIENARKELGLVAPRPFQPSNLTDIKTKLNRSSRISELREKLAAINKNKQKLEELDKVSLNKDKVKLQAFAPIDFEFNISPSKTAYQSPTKNITPSPKKSPFKSPIKSPAFQRFSSLIQPFSTGLILPYKHRLLLEIFHCTDTVVSMFFNRRETVTFSKLKTGVQEMLRRNFTERHLGQIKNVMPDYYRFSYEKSKKQIQSNSSKYELIIIPVLNVKDNDNVEADRVRMGTKTLEERRNGFENALISDVKKHHSAYLLSLDPPLILSQDTINRWHASFDVDSVREISPDALPTPPDASDKTVYSAKDMLEKAKKVLSCNPRMSRALEQIESRSTKTSTSTTTETDTITKQAIALEAKLKGLPAALLEKVRARQAAKAMHEMTCTPAQAQDTIRYTRLPEIARFTRAIFVSEKKNVLPFEQVVIKLGDSLRENLTRPERETHLRLLIESVPGWISQITDSNTLYIRMNKQANLAKISSDLEQLAQSKRNPSS